MFLNPYLFAIVSIEPIEPNEKTGLSGEVDGSFKESSGNTQRKDYSRGIKLQYDYKNSADYIINNYIYSESGGEKIEESSFTHFRHLNALSRIVVWELYAQSEENEFINLNLRELAGTGLRLRFFKSDTLRLYMGLGVYASNEEYSLSSGSYVRESANRGNFYLSYKHKVKEEFEATATIYYQPAMEDASDYYLLANGDIKFFLTEKLAMKLSFGAKEDTEPFEGNKHSDTYYVLGVGYKF